MAPDGLRTCSGSLALCAGIALGCASAASAQTVAPTRDELTRTQPATEPARPRLEVQGDVERAPCPLAGPEFADIKVTIRDVVFNGLKGVPPAEMREVWADAEGREQPVALICDLRDRAATLLRNKGYLAAVQVPAQRIENGVVRLEVLYGRLVAVRARGQTTGAEGKLARYLQPLTEAAVFNRFTAERYLLLARDLPGYNVQLTLRPAGTGPGELVGEVTVVRRPYALDVSLQNLAAAATGRWGSQVRAQAYGITGLGDVSTIGYYNTVDWREQRILQLGHQFRPGGEGLTVDGQFTYAWTRPDIGDASPPLRARTLFASLSAAYPLVRRQGHNWWVAGGMDLINQEVELIEPLSRDKLRAAWLRTDADWIDLSRSEPRWRASASLELRKGLDILGASRSCAQSGCGIGVTPPSRSDGRPTATLLRGVVSAEQVIGRNFSIFLSPRAQLAFAPVLAFEEFTAGNFTVGRGYDPGFIVGDSGVGLTAELRGPRLPAVRSSTFQWQPYLFSDAVWVWNKHVSGDPERVLSAGGGVRASLSDRIRLEIAYARPLWKAGLFDEKPDSRVLVNLTARPLPWR